VTIVLWIVLCALWLAYESRQRLIAKVAASRLARHAVVLQATSATYEPADPKGFPHLDLAWYQTATETLKSMGFAHVEDIIDVEARRRNLSAPTFMRILLSPDGVTIGGLFHVRGRGWRHILARKPRADHRIVTLATELSNGVFLGTSNALSAGRFDYGPQIRSQRVDSNDPAEVLKQHQHRVGEALALEPRLAPTVCRTVTDIRALMEREQHAKGSYRRTLKPGFTEAELIGPAGADEERTEMVRKIVNEFPKSGGDDDG